MIRAESVSYSYSGGGQTVSDLTFHIQKGEFVALIGENGAGKTTTVKLIDGLLRPTSGRMLVNGMDTVKSKVSERARQVGFLFQNPDRQICKNTVRDEIAFGLRAVWGRGEAAKIDERVKELLDLFSFRGDEEPFSLSRGQRQQVALASTLAVKPAVLILDEPTTGLDYRECTKIMEFIRNLNETEGTTVVMVCHDMEVVLDYARRALVMAGGRLLADGPVREIFRDADLMARASLLPPQIIQLSGRLGGRYALADDAETLAELIAEGDRRGTV
ncbi:MAG: energy-coupling factor ABC transporter ATP-binding protein [Ruminococcaceae bacterium]|nr:energy-coupling factor ABC transporter ATP-binding protein [Oscillospiraceae bacterium]